MKNVLIIGLVWPEPDATAAGSRMLQLIQFFITQKSQITFASTASFTTHSVALNTLGVATVSIELNQDSFDEFVRTLQPDIVIFDRFIAEEQFGWRVTEQVPGAIRILDTEDLHSLRAARHECFKLGIPFTYDAWLQNETTKREIASIYRCDISLIISSFEMELLTKVLKIDEYFLLHIPFMLKAITKKEIAQWQSYEQRKDFVFIGTGKHAPNIDAIKWLRQDIWPAIRKLMPEAKLKIYGSYLPESIMQMHQPKEGFYVLGWAKDAKAVIAEAKVFLAPLRFGAGLKGKLVNAMQCGTPSVTTSIGIEGMHREGSWNGFVEDDSNAFAEAAVKLYNNEAKWLQSQKNGISIINRNFSKKEFYGVFLKKVLSLHSNLEKHRKNNFIGVLLQHQSMASTKYLSRWIALKNKQ